jgi:hypothetical protein
VVQEQLVSRQNQLAQAEGEIALGLIQVYRALGGGWQIRCATKAGPATCASRPGAILLPPVARVTLPPASTIEAPPLPRR